MSTASHLLLLAAAVSFVVGLRQMGSPASARRGNQLSAAGMAVAIVVMTALWAAQQFGLMSRVVDTLWFSLIGSTITVAVGSASAALRGGREGEAHREVEVTAGTLPDS